MIKNRRRQPGRDVKILSDRMLGIKGSAEHSRWTCIDRPSRSADEQLHNNAPHRKWLREKTTACVSLLVFLRIRRGTFPYSVEHDASTISQTLATTHCTNTTCVKLTIVTKKNRPKSSTTTFLEGERNVQSRVRAGLEPTQSRRLRVELL